MKTNRFLVLALAAALLPLWACERDEPVTPADVGGGGSPAVEEPIPTPVPTGSMGILWKGKCMAHSLLCPFILSMTRRRMC